MSPLVSICIPNYLHADLFERCLQSIITQDYKNLEVIVSDDSPDNSVKIIVEKYSDQIKVNYWHNNPSLGTPANWNQALDKGNGDFLMLLHHDDWLAGSQVISHCVTAFENKPEATVLFGRSMAIDKLLKNEPDPFKASYFNAFYKKPGKLLLNNVIGPPSNVMVKKQVKARYDCHYKWLVDIEYYIRLIQERNQFLYLDERLINVGLHEGQMTNYVHQNGAIMVRENVLFAQKYLKLIHNNLQVYDHLWRLLRNQNIRSVEDVLATGLAADQVPDFIINMIQAQAKLSLASLKNGLVSKALMLHSYLIGKL